MDLDVFLYFTTKSKKNVLFKQQLVILTCRCKWFVQSLWTISLIVEKMKLNFVVFLLLVFCFSAYTDKENNKDTSKLVTDYLENGDPDIPVDEAGTTSKSTYC